MCQLMFLGHENEDWESFIDQERLKRVASTLPPKESVRPQSCLCLLLAIPMPLHPPNLHRLCIS